MIDILMNSGCECVYMITAHRLGDVYNIIQKSIKPIFKPNKVTKPHGMHDGQSVRASLISTAARVEEVFCN